MLHVTCCYLRDSSISFHLQPRSSPKMPPCRPHLRYVSVPSAPSAPLPHDRPPKPLHQVQRNVGHGAITFDELYYNSCEHLGLCNMACNNAVDPPAQLRLHSCARYFAGRPGLGAGDPCQHQMPMAKPVYAYAADYLKDRNFTPFDRARRAAPASDQPPHQPALSPATPSQLPPLAQVPTSGSADPALPVPAGNVDAVTSTEDAPPTPSTPAGTAAAAPARRNRRRKPANPSVPNTDPTSKDAQLQDGFSVYRSFTDTVILQTQQRQDNSSSGQLLQKYASLFNGTHGYDLRTEAGRALMERAMTAMLDDLAGRSIRDLRSLYETLRKTIRVVTFYNEVRHFINTTCLLLDAERHGARVTVWNARHQRCGCGREGNRVSLTALENVAAMRAPDKRLDHFTPDTYVFPGCLVTLLTTNAEAGATRNMVVRVRGLITHPDEPEDDGSGPHRRLQYMPLGVIVEHVTGASTADFLKGEKEFEGLPDGAFVVRPQLSQKAHTVTVPDQDGREQKLTIRRYNVPLGDAYCVTDYFVQVCLIPGRRAAPTCFMPSSFTQAPAVTPGLSCAIEWVCESGAYVSKQNSRALPTT